MVWSNSKGDVLVALGLRIRKALSLNIDFRIYRM